MSIIFRMEWDGSDVWAVASSTVAHYVGRACSRQQADKMFAEFCDEYQTSLRLAILKREQQVNPLFVI